MTLFYPFWHKDVESFIVLKNQKGTEDTRVRHIDYGIQLNRLFWKHAIKGWDITLFCPNDVPDLYEAFFRSNEEFEELYYKYSKDPNIKRKSVNGTELLNMIVSERASTGRVYTQNIDHCNINGPFNPMVAPIRQSNLCVAPETKILTDNGFETISDLEDEEVNVWNGVEWSRTVVRKTGENQKIIKVTTDSGFELECTPYHKFYVVRRNPKTSSTSVEEKRAHELVVGDKLIKSNFPVIQGEDTLKFAYANGFYSGDGCLTRNGKRIYLYNEKRELKHHLGDIFKTWYVQEASNREYGESDYLISKDFVPTSNYTISSRIEWFEGLCDSDGTIARNGKTQNLQVGSVNKPFLQDVQLLLQTLGVSSKVTKAVDAGYRPLPKNDGSGETALFNCKAGYRLLVGQTGINNLKELGFNPKRLLIKDHEPDRECTHFVKITSVEDDGRISDTYCFTESKRGMGVFNGMLTGQCLEITLPTKPLVENKPEEGEIALCTLVAFNLAKVTKENIGELSDIAIRSIDALFDYQEYPVKAAEHARKRRAIGAGVINLAYYLAKHGVKYSDGSANNLTHELFEMIQYHLLDASANLAAERGRCEYFGDTKYSQGLLPIDWYNKNVDKLHTTSLKMDWEALREKIAEHGLRNSTVTALMPSETSSQISNATNGIEPPREFTTTKSSKSGSYKMVVPDVKDLYENYELAFDMPNNIGYLDLVALMQKFVDQSISANTYYNPSRYPDGKVPADIIIAEMLHAYKHGVKTMYYHNTDDGFKQESRAEDDCAGGACKI